MRSTSFLGFLINDAGIARSKRETIDCLEISGCVDPTGADEIADALSCISGVDGWNVSIRDGEDESIALADISGEDINVTITKPVGGRLFFATLEGFAGALADSLLADATEILVLDEFPPFATRRFRVVPWGGAPQPGLPSAQLEPASVPVDPRRGLVRDLTGEEVTDDPLRWLLSGAEGSGAVWEGWRLEATRRLAVIPASEVWSEAGETKVSLLGDRKRVFSFDRSAIEPATAFKPLADAVEWLIVDRGAEARHEMLTRRLAAIIPEGASWQAALPNSIAEAVEGAKVDFRAYARSKSAETLKAIADLRKAVSDDVTRIVERAHRLSNGLIASFVALTAGLALRLVITASKGSFATSLVFAAVVLSATWAGVLLQRHVSTQSLLDELRSMKKWHCRVHFSLSRDEYREIARKPVKDAVKLYQRTAVKTFRMLCGASLIFLFLIIIVPIFTGQQGPSLAEKAGQDASSKTSK